MMTKKTVWMTLSLVCCLALFCAVVYTGMLRPTPMETAGTSAKKLTANPTDDKNPANERPGPISRQDAGQTERKNPAAFTDWAVMSLRSDLLETISLKSSQAALIQFRLYLAEKYPDTWQQLFDDIIRRAFPDHAEEIFATLSTLDVYNTWLEDNKAALSNLDHHEIKEALWAKRHELFGEEADELWAEETRTEMIKEVLDIMRDDYDTGIDHKLTLYTQAIHDTYQDGTVPVLGDRKYYLTRAFFRMDSVQDSLKDMSDTDRAESIRNVRKVLGYSDEDIEKLAQNDAENEVRWQQGYRYMDERSQILAEYQGDEQTRRIADLQDAYFGTRAKTIRAEEADGFFRFERPRVYGSN